MNPKANFFYVAGGTIPGDAPSYVTRQADEDLYRSLMQGEFCYVLTARQMGKSSLMVRTVARLRDSAAPPVKTVILDLSALGRNLTLEQWYVSLRDRVGQQLDIEDEMEDFWHAHRHLSPMQRFFDALEKIALPSLRPQTTDSSALTSPAEGTIRPPEGTQPLPERIIPLPEAAKERSEGRPTFPGQEKTLTGAKKVFPEGKIVLPEGKKSLEEAKEPLSEGLERLSEETESLGEETGYLGDETEVLDEETEVSVKETEGLDEEAENFDDETEVLTKEKQRFVEEKQLFAEGTDGPALSNARPGGGTAKSASLVLFLDEIDFVRSLPFDTDEFFAAIRACYNQRATNPVFNRLTFCLLGVASPAELITENRVTPFNIGRRIELYDFTPREGRVLASGLHASAVVAGRLLSRVLYWTGGHPYLTQKLCQSLVGTNAVSEADVDRLCAALFLLPEARTGESNLVFVASRFLNSGQDVPSLLELYRTVLRGKTVRNSETSRLQNVLKISGLVRVEKGCLRVRNRIYAQAFDREWIREQTPDTERKRQRTAYLHGLVRAGLIGSVALALVGGLAFYAMQQTRRANEVRQRLQATLADIYESDMNTAQREWSLGNPRLVARIVDRYRNNWNERNPPPFLWRTQWGLVHQDIATLRAHSRPVLSVAMTANGRYFASAGADQTVCLWDAVTHKIVWKAATPTQRAACVAFSPNSELLAASGGSDREGWVQVWNAADGKRLHTLTQDCPVWAVAFSPDGKTLAAGCSSETQEARGRVLLWEVGSWQKRLEWPESIGPGRTLAFSPTGALLATGSARRRNNSVSLWDARTGTLLRGFPSPEERPIACVAFSPDGKTLAFGADRTVLLRDVESGRLLRMLSWHTGRVNDVGFAREGKQLASVGSDYTVRLWEPATGKLVRTLRGHEDRVNAAVFSPDGSHLISGGNDGSVRIWDALGPDRSRLILPPNACSNVRLAPDGSRLALTMADGSIRLWDIGLWRPLRTLKRRGSQMYAVGFTSDSRELIVSMEGKSIQLWDLASEKSRPSAQFSGAHRFFHALSPDGQRLVFCDLESKTLRCCDVATGAALCPPIVFAERPVAAAFSPDNRTFAVALDDPRYRILLLDALTGREQKTLQAVDGDPNTGHTNTITQVAFSPAGDRLASASTDASVVLWETASGKCLSKIEAHRGTVSQVAFSPDGATLATGGAQDHLVKLWTGTPPRTSAVFAEHSQGIKSVLFSADGRLLITRDRQSLRFWLAPTYADILKRQSLER